MYKNCGEIFYFCVCLCVCIHVYINKGKVEKKIYGDKCFYLQKLLLYFFLMGKTQESIVQKLKGVIDKFFNTLAIITTSFVYFFISFSLSFQEIYMYVKIQSIKYVTRAHHKISSLNIPSLVENCIEIDDKSCAFYFSN